MVRRNGALVAAIVCPMSTSVARRTALPYPFRALLERIDARWFQLLFLASFLLFGALARDFALSVLQVALCFIAGLATQVLWQ